MFQNINIGAWLIAIFMMLALTIVLTEFGNKRLLSAIFISVLLVVMVQIFLGYQQELRTIVDRADISLMRFLRKLVEDLIRLFFSDTDANYILNGW